MNKPIISLIRGAYLNPFEMQNYAPLSQQYAITTYSSLYPLGIHPDIPNIRLPSITDLMTQLDTHNLSVGAKAIAYIARRTHGGEHGLLGLETKIHQSDIIHTADPHYLFSYQSIRIKDQRRRVRVICTSWEVEAHHNESIALKKYQKESVLRRADLFICHTKKAQTALELEGVLKDSIQVVPLGVDTKTFFPQPRNIQRGCILFVGRLVPEKGVMTLLSAFEDLYKTNSYARLFILGSGPLEHKIRAQLKLKGLTHAVSIMKIQYNSISQMYQKAEIFVLPSTTSATWSEQYGMALIEAMASALPIVSTTTGAIPEVVGPSGLLVHPDNASELCTAMHELLTNPDMRLKLGTIGYERAKNMYNVSKFSQKMAQIYAELLNSHPHKK